MFDTKCVTYGLMNVNDYCIYFHNLEGYIQNTERQPKNVISKKSALKNHIGIKLDN